MYGRKRIRSSSECSIDRKRPTMSETPTDIVAQQEPKRFKKAESGSSKTVDLQARKNAEKIRKAASRASETPAQLRARQEKARIRTAASRTSETPALLCARQEKARIRTAASRTSETPAQLCARQEKDRIRKVASRTLETPAQLCARQETDRIRKVASRTSETPNQLRTRQEKERLRKSKKIAAETLNDKQSRLEANRTISVINRHRPWTGREHSAFSYDPNIDYFSFKFLSLGSMVISCPFCHAYRWKGETSSICCNNGKIHLSELPDPPEPIYDFLTDDSHEAQHFRSNIRAYNSCFQMTSFGSTKEIRESGYMPTFKVQGQIYHLIGSLHPLPNEDPKFLQIYFIGDSIEQAKQRCNISGHPTRFEVVLRLQEMFHRHNSYIRSLKCAMETISPDYTLIIRADKTPSGEHERRFNAPVASEVAAILTGEQHGTRDIVLQLRDNSLKRINETHRSYDALQYPIIFCNGEDGYHFELRQITPQTGTTTAKKISSMDFYAYRMMVRPNCLNHILKCKDLFHQFAVDMYSKIESERLRYIRLNQKKLRVENYIHLRDAINVDGNAANVGQLIVLPSSFIGGPRYMHERTQDAMTYVRNYCRPDLFATFTCNPSWTEITNELMPGQKPQDRHDLMARVFRLKVKAFMDLITKCNVFGPIRCHMYTIEWQKRGLPHAHILLWFHDKLHVHRVDDIISAEIPNPELDSMLFSIVKKHMVHGPCGNINPLSPCMRDGKCTKGYPRKMIKETQTGQDGYPQYRRRSPQDGGFVTSIIVRGHQTEIDNRWIVPYCPLLSLLFEAHINVEYCHSVKSIKYICKYINKGSDMAVFGLSSHSVVHDEVQSYQLGRYISSNEAIWRIFGFPIHNRHPTVVHLNVHLENGQRVYFTEENAYERIMLPQGSTLTAFFDLCTVDNFAKTLFYNQVPKYYTWNSSTKKWSRRKEGQIVEGYPDIRATDALGRVYTVHPNNLECFYLRLLLHEVKGPKSFIDLRTFDDTICETYHQACQLRGLLEDDSHWKSTLDEAASSHSPSMLRNLFAIMLQTCSMSNPRELWDRFKDKLSEDILHQAKLVDRNLELDYNDEIFNQALIIIENKIIDLGSSNVKEFGLPETVRDNHNMFAIEVLRETNYNIDDLTEYVQEHETSLVEDQRNVINTITGAVLSGKGGCFFLDAPGGTGKTFVINVLLAKIRQRKMIALAVASSGIAATLLSGGRTAHSVFKLPLNLASDETPTCNIGRGTGKASLLQQCKLIVWDECTMSHKAAVEALDRTMKDLRHSDQTMGGVTLLLAGDFRQTLPVIPRGTKADELNACLKASYLWKNVQRLVLKTNMRVHLTGDESSGEFAATLLKLGNGVIPSDDQDGTISVSKIGQSVSTLQELIESIFPDLQYKFSDHSWLCERAILAPTNDSVNKINTELLSLLPGSLETFKSVDTLPDPNDIVNYPTEFLNSLELPGVPPHNLELKIGAPIILLRNLDPPTLCNGTRLAVKKLMTHVIEATILTGHGANTDVFIPRIPIIPSDLPFQFKRLQFPVRLSFAMSINKSQGQSFKFVGLNLHNPCFSHGQLYVGCSRVGKCNNLFVLAPDGKTKNIVYQEALRN